MKTLLSLLLAPLLSLLAHGDQIKLIPRPEKTTPHENLWLTLTQDTSITIVEDPSIAPEGYHLDIGKKGITIKSSSAAGTFYACQTLKQWLPNSITLTGELGGNPRPVLQLTGNQPAEIKCASIQDNPKYPWRGFMLDSGRQYHSMDYLKKTIRILSHYKFNTFHWHLTEGHGWRIQIDRYPRLTSVGSNVGPWQEQKGYYTKDQIRELVAYAAERHITIVPEIDVPGHSNAALIAYPEHTCFRKAPKAETIWTADILCGGREDTYVFLNHILDEVCELFPSRYIHLGGDEALKNNWNKCPDCQSALKQSGGKNMHDLQIQMMNRLAAHLAKKGRKTICWGDVVTHPGPPLSEHITVMWWNYRLHKNKGLRNAVNQGRECIMAPNYFTYLNFPVTPKLPDYKKVRTFNLKMAYEKNPTQEADKLPEEKRPLVLGINPCLWTDHNLMQHQLDERIYPRILALAELNWHKGERENFALFHTRVKQQYPNLRSMGAKIGPAMAEDEK